MKEFDSVILITDLPEHKLRVGDVGVIVHKHGRGEAFIVEFMTVKGETVAVVTLEASKVRPARSKDMQSVRALA